MGSQVDPATLPGKSKASAAVKIPPSLAAEPSAAAEPASEVAPASGKGQPLTEQQRHEYIETAAYRLAERRSFEPGHEHEDWLAAEALIDATMCAPA